MGTTHHMIYVSLGAELHIHTCHICTVLGRVTALPFGVKMVPGRPLSQPLEVPLHWVEINCKGRSVHRRKEDEGQNFQGTTLASTRDPKYRIILDLSLAGCFSML